MSFTTFRSPLSISINPNSTSGSMSISSQEQPRKRLLSGLDEESFELKRPRFSSRLSMFARRREYISPRNVSN